MLQCVSPGKMLMHESSLSYSSNHKFPGTGLHPQLQWVMFLYFCSVSPGALFMISRNPTHMSTHPSLVNISCYHMSEELSTTMDDSSIPPTWPTDGYPLLLGAQSIRKAIVGWYHFVINTCLIFNPAVYPFQWSYHMIMTFPFWAWGDYIENSVLYWHSNCWENEQLRWLRSLSKGLAMLA